MKQEFGTPISRTATGATAAYALVTGVPGVRVYITDIGVSGDLVTGAVYQVLSGTAVKWQGVINNASPLERSFREPIRCESGATATVQITGTAAAAANFSGFTNNS